MRRVAISGIAFAILFLAAGAVSQAAVFLSVVLGSDYLTSPAGLSSFPGLGTVGGVPLGPATGNTDTIVQRLSDAIFPGAPGPGNAAPAISTNLSALQLETMAPVNFAGDGLDNYFVTLQSVGGGPIVFSSEASNQMDFFPFGEFQEVHPNGSVPAVEEASATTPTPEPATSLLIGVGLLGLATIWKRKGR